MGTVRPASPALEAFIDEAIRLASQHDYHPTVFQGMRRQHGTIEAIEKLVQSGDVQSGFKWLHKLGLLDWTIESAVVKFPIEFSRNAFQCAAWRLEQVKKEKKSAE